MDQELKQRLIGAAVITALAAIFVPMLFDDPIDETGKSINELKIPELPTKAQDVEIMPLPEKVEDVAGNLPVETPGKAPVKVLEEGEAEAEMAAPQPQTKLPAPIQRKLPTATPPAPVAQIDEEPAEAEDIPVVSRPAKLPAAAPAQAVQPLQTSPVPKPLKPGNKLPELKAEPSPSPSPAAVAPTAVVKSLPAAEESNRWYLQVGTFSQKPNATSLQDNLKQQGFAASVKEVATDKGTVFKVRIGPIVDKAKAQAVKAKLAQINVNSFVSADE